MAVVIPTLMNVCWKIIFDRLAREGAHFKHILAIFLWLQKLNGFTNQSSPKNIL